MDPRAIRTRKALQDALLELLKTDSFDQITPRHIAAKAGLAHGTFYRHHPSKEAMLDELAKKEINDLHQRQLQLLGTSGLRAVALSYADYFIEKRELWSVLLNGGANAIVREEWLKLARSQAREHAHPGDRLPHDLSTAFATSALVEIVGWWLRQDQGHSVDFFADMLIELLFDPIRKASTSPNLKF
ncbi:TetR/AcrR family transcriptional regulator [Novosphingobium sp. 18052]|nr:TetR/AcrR family transcriptional regulator [Novosphingobium sp. 18052]